MHKLSKEHDILIVDRALGFSLARLESRGETAEMALELRTIKEALATAVHKWRRACEERAAAKGRAQLLRCQT